MRDDILALWIGKKLGKVSYTEDDLKEYQLKKLNETLNNAKKSIFYRKRILKDRLENLEEIASLPFTTSSDIERFNIKMLSVSQDEIERIVTLPTSGTSKEPKRIFFTKSDLELTIDFFRNGLSQLNSKKMLIMMPLGNEYSVGDLICKAISQDGVIPIPLGIPKSFHNIEREFYEADGIVAPPIILYAFLNYMHHKKNIKKLNGILVSSDYLPDIIRVKLEELSSSKVFDHYGITEAGLGGAVQCDHHFGLHPREADLYFEIINPHTGEILKDGDFGEIVFTTLTREGMPLIRYRTGDIGRFLKGKCPCKMPGKTLDKIQGRIDERNVPIAISKLDEVIFSINGVMDYKLKYISCNHMHFLVFCFSWNIVKEEEIRRNLLLLNLNMDITIEIIVSDDWVKLYNGKRIIEYEHSF